MVLEGENARKGRRRRRRRRRDVVMNGFIGMGCQIRWKGKFVFSSEGGV